MIATHVPPAIRSLAAAAANRPRAVRPRPTSGPSEVQVVVSPPRIGASRTVPPTVPNRPMPVRMMAWATFRVYAFSMRRALGFRTVALSAAAFQSWFAKKYWQATMFVGAHVQGVVTGSVAQSRRTVCDGCEMRKMVNKHDRCGAMDCGCSVLRWWAPTWLSWLRQLVGWDCPRGKWQASGGTDGS